MKKKIVVGLITIVAIVSVVMFAGCIEHIKEALKQSFDIEVFNDFGESYKVGVHEGFSTVRGPPNFIFDSEIVCSFGFGEHCLNKQLKTNRYVTEMIL